MTSTYKAYACKITFPFLCLFLFGCSENVPMHGRVTYSDDGEPLTKGTVVFVDGSQQARGDIDEKGKFVIGFVKEKDGLPKGDYRVYIAGAIYYEGTQKNPYQKEVVLIDRKYADPATSPLSIAVDGSKRSYDIVVERP